MPKTYYAVSTPLKSSTVNMVKKRHHADLVKEVTHHRYGYNDLIEVLNEDHDLKLFESEVHALAYAAPKEVIETKEQRKLGLLDLAAAVIVPHYVFLKGLSLVASAGATETNIYQPIILKITLRSDQSIKADETATENCVGVIPELELMYETEHRTQQYSLRFSQNQNSYVHKLQFRHSVYLKEFLTSPYPEKYKNKFHAQAADVNHALAILKDYFAPQHGLFLTGHWNRSHKNLACQLYNDIKDLDSNSALKMLWDKRFELSKMRDVNQEGSFMRRLSFAIDMLAADNKSLPNYRP